MKSIVSITLAVILALTFVVSVGAQTAESIWLTADAITYKTGQTVTVAVNATSATPIQGFTFQIRYDPECLKPINAASTVPGMNALPLPQTVGLADGSYAGATPQMVNGVLATVHFKALKGCQTNLTLESAALAIRNASGFAAPLSSVTLGQERSLALSIDKTKVAAEPEAPVSGAVLPLEPAPATNSNSLVWIMALLFIFILGIMFVAFNWFRIGATTTSEESMDAESSVPSPMPMLQIRHGPNAGKNFTLNKLPCFIGRDPVNEICLNDPHIIDQHVKIFTKDNSYYLMDLGGETFINGRAIHKSSTALKSGDVVRLGKSALFVFGS